MKNEKTAELIGIILGDGHIEKVNCGHHQLKIGTNTKTSKKYLTVFTKQLIKDVLDIDTKYYDTKNNETLLYFNSKKKILELEKLGLIPGNKVKHNVGIPKWVFEDKKYLKSCLRGLIDTDGCIYPKYKYPYFPQLEFYSRSKNLLYDARRAFQILGFKISNICEKAHTAKIGLYSKSEVKRFANEIGFNNPNNINRYRKIMLP